MNQPGVKLDRATETVTFLGDRTLKLADYRKAKRVYLNRSDSQGHPVMGHPVSGKDPRKPGVTISCLSCHVPHSSPALSLLVPEAEQGDIGLCGQCHK